MSFYDAVRVTAMKPNEVRSMVCSAMAWESRVRSACRSLGLSTSQSNVDRLRFGIATFLDIKWRQLEHCLNQRPQDIDRAIEYYANDFGVDAKDFKAVLSKVAYQEDRDLFAKIGYVI